MIHFENWRVGWIWILTIFFFVGIFHFHLCKIDNNFYGWWDKFTGFFSRTHFFCYLSNVISFVIFSFDSKFIGRRWFELKKNWDNSFWYQKKRESSQNQHFKCPNNVSGSNGIGKKMCETKKFSTNKSCYLIKHFGEKWKRND